MDQILSTKKFKVEQKTFYFDLKENHNGKFLRITEASGRRSSIIIPDSGFQEFIDTLHAITNGSQPQENEDPYPY